MGLIMQVFLVLSMLALTRGKKIRHGKQKKLQVSIPNNWVLDNNPGGALANMCFVGPADGASLFNSCKQILNEDPDLNPGYRQDPNLPAYQAGPNAFTRIDTTQNQIYGYHYSTNTPGAPGNVHPHFTLRLLQGNVATAALNNQILYTRLVHIYR